MVGKTTTPKRLRRRAHEYAEAYEDNRRGHFDSMDDAAYVSYFEGYCAGYMAAKKEQEESLPSTVTENQT